MHGEARDALQTRLCAHPTSLTPSAHVLHKASLGTGKITIMHNAKISLLMLGAECQHFQK